MANKGKLYLIPAPIAGDSPPDRILPPGSLNQLAGIRYFLAENVRTARRFLSALHLGQRIEDLSFSVLDKDTKEDELPLLFAPANAGHDLGVLSESGCPGIADPGALAARYAHENDIRVIPLVGPSSLLLALMASGLNGQHFAFHGYLPIQPRAAAKVIRDLEKESRLKNQTQIFIETPYRNNGLFANLVRTLQPQTLLCLAVDITGGQESIRTRTVGQWRSDVPDIPKLPAVFLFLA